MHKQNVKHNLENVKRNFKNIFPLDCVGLTKNQSLAIKMKTFSGITDEYSQISITLPEDGKKILFAQSDSCLMVKQTNYGDYEDFRCFGSLGYCKLERMDNINISGWVYYV